MGKRIYHLKKLILFSMLTVSLFAYQKGDTVDIALQKHLDMKTDKIYIIDFFASWCASCKKEIPLISKVNTTLDQDHVEIIGIDVDKDEKKGVAFQKKLTSEGKLNFRVVNDPMNLIVAKFNPIGMPALYYIKEGRVVDIIYGAVDNIDQKIILDMEKL